MKTLMVSVVRLLRITGFYIGTFPYEKPSKQREVFTIVYCVVSNLLLLINIGRYLTIFHGENRINGSLMSALAILFFWLQVTYMSITLSVCLPGNLLQLFVAVTEYRNKTCFVDEYYQKLKRVFVVFTAFFCILFPVFMIPLSGTIDSILPSMKRYTTPFNSLEGTPHVIAMVFYGFLLISNGLHMYSAAALFVLTSACIIKEFTLLSEQFSDTLMKRNGKMPITKRPHSPKEHASVETAEITNTPENSQENTGEAVPNLDIGSASNGEMNMDMAPTFDSFDALVKRHQRICHIVALANKFICHIIAAAYVCVIPTLCFLIYGLIKGELSMDEWIYCTFCGFFSFSTLLGVTVVSIYVNDKAHEPLQILLRGNWTDFALRQKVSFFTQRLTAEQIGFSVYGLFVIDRSSFLMVFGTVLTYAVVVLQINPDSGSAVCDDMSLCYNITSVLCQTLQT